LSAFTDLPIAVSTSPKLDSSRFGDNAQQSLPVSGDIEGKFRDFTVE
jgi:hypothetical protein